MQEAVFETLTKQYELAKVEEARETPSVKVLDVADVPERKSYPPANALHGTIERSWFLFSGHARSWPTNDGKRPIPSILVRRWC